MKSRFDEVWQSLLGKALPLFYERDVEAFLFNLPLSIISPSFSLSLTFIAETIHFLQMLSVNAE